MRQKLLVLCITLLYASFTAKAQVQRPSELPMIGAQVIVEPDHNKEQIEHYFKVLHENGFSVCRIRMFETYMKSSNNEWDFTLFEKMMG